MKVKCYTELSRLTTFEERYLNQVFYRSKEWKAVRDLVIIRDCGCDLGVPGYEIHGHILIHHLNPISVEDIERRTLTLLNPEYLICTTHNTHNAIHYGDADLLIKGPVQRTKNDTCPWRH